MAVSTKRSPQSRPGRFRPPRHLAHPGRVGAGRRRHGQRPGDEQAGHAEQAQHHRRHAGRQPPELQAGVPAPRRGREEEHRVHARGHGEDHRRHPAEEGQLHVGVQRREELAGEERPHAVDRQSQAEQGRQRESAVGQDDQAGGERPPGEAPQAHPDVPEMEGDADGQQTRGRRQPGPGAEMEMSDHARHGDGEDGELPAGEPLAPDRALEHDRDELVAGAHDRERDPPERDGVGEGEQPRVVVVARQLGPEPRDAQRGHQEGDRGTDQVGERDERREAARRPRPLRQAHPAPLRMRMRTSPGSGSSVSCTKPRSSSWG